MPQSSPSVPVLAPRPRPPSSSSVLSVDDSRTLTTSTSHSASQTQSRTASLPSVPSLPSYLFASSSASAAPSIPSSARSAESDSLSQPEAVEVLNATSLLLGFASAFEPERAFQLPPNQFALLPLASRVLLGDAIVIPLVAPGRYRIAESATTRKLLVQRLDPQRGTYSQLSHPVRIANETGDCTLLVSCAVTDALSAQFPVLPRQHVFAPLHCCVVVQGLCVPMTEEGEYQVARKDVDIKVMRRDLSSNAFSESHPIGLANTSSSTLFYSTRHGQFAALPPTVRVLLPIATFLHLGDASVPLYEEGVFQITDSPPSPSQASGNSLPGTEQDPPEPVFRLVKLDLMGGPSVESHPVKVFNATPHVLQYSTVDEQTTSLAPRKRVYLPLGAFLAKDAQNIPFTEAGDYIVRVERKRESERERDCDTLSVAALASPSVSLCVWRRHRGTYCVRSHPIAVQNNTAQVWTVKSAVVQGRGLLRFAMPPGTEVHLCAGMTLFLDTLSLPLSLPGEFSLSHSVTGTVSLHRRDDRLCENVHCVRVENALSDTAVRVCAAPGQSSLSPLQPAHSALLPRGALLIWGALSLPLCEAGEYRLSLCDALSLSLSHNLSAKSTGSIYDNLPINKENKGNIDANEVQYMLWRRRTQSSVHGGAGRDRDRDRDREREWQPYLSIADPSRMLTHTQRHALSVDEDVFLCASLSALAYNADFALRESVECGAHTLSLLRTSEDDALHTTHSHTLHWTMWQLDSVPQTAETLTDTQSVANSVSQTRAQPRRVFLVFRGPPHTLSPALSLSEHIQWATQLPLLLSSHTHEPHTQSHTHYGYHSGTHSLLMNSFSQLLSALPPLTSTLVPPRETHKNIDANADLNTEMDADTQTHANTHTNTQTSSQNSTQQQTQQVSYAQEHTQLYVTGHALGGALAQAFTLYCRFHCAHDPELCAATPALSLFPHWRCVTFAAPQTLFVEAGAETQQSILADTHTLALPLPLPQTTVDTPYYNGISQQPLVAQIRNFHFKSDVLPMLPHVLHSETFLHALRERAASAPDALVRKVFGHCVDVLCGLREGLSDRELAESLRHTQFFLPAGETVLLDADESESGAWFAGDGAGECLGAQSLAVHSMHSILKALASRLRY